MGPAGSSRRRKGLGLDGPRGLTGPAAHAGGRGGRFPQDAGGGRHPGGPRRQTGVPFAYVRLLGDREAVDALAPTLDHIVIDRGGQVAEDARAIRVLRQRVPVVAFVNNPYAGYAAETARQLAELTDATAGQREPP